jgi:SNF2 family DNA or RNA helicase
MATIFETGFDSWAVKLMAGNKMVPVTITKRGDRLDLQFGYNPKMLEEVKSFDGAKWHGFDENNPRKIWSIKDNPRNRFQLSYLAHPGASDPLNPYVRYRSSLQHVQPNRSVYAHQGGMIDFGYTRHYCILAAEMGTGKTLTAIEIMEASKMDDWIWVGPKSALVSVKVEFGKWKTKVAPKFVTYEGLQKLLADWPAGRPAPHGVVFDECSRCKNPTAKRTQAAKYLADSIRKEWGPRGYVLLMSGTPAPKSPADWWSICEIACPGFIREGTIDKFKQRLAIIEMREQAVGLGAFPHLVAWKDDEKKCGKCGLYKEAETHSEGVDVYAATQTNHRYEPSVNEVAKLYRRMSGLVEVRFKKDCLELPDKVYEEIVCTPSRSILNAARAIEARTTSTVSALTLLRELSDGFQYFDRKEGTTVCPGCHGKKMISQPVVEEPDIDGPTAGEIKAPEWETVACPECKGTGEIDKMVRDTKVVPCPKDDELRNVLDTYDDVGRVVVFGGFTGTIDRIVDTCLKLDWKIIRVDGRGWHNNMGLKTPEDMVRAFQNELTDRPRIAFISHPGSGGMGLTLTASPVILYYSNDFNAESRLQSEDRIHRAGMDVNRGAKIIDLIHLPTDKVVLDNLKNKRRLQDMTMGELKAQTELIEPALTASQVISRL